MVGILPTGISGSAALLLYGQIIILGGTTTTPETPNSNIFVLDVGQNYSVSTLPSHISLNFGKATFAVLRSMTILTIFNMYKFAQKQFVS